MDSPQDHAPDIDCEKGTTDRASVRTSRKKFYLILLLGAVVIVAAGLGKLSSFHFTTRTNPRLGIGLGVHFGLQKVNDTVHNVIKSSGTTVGSSPNSTSTTGIGDGPAIDSNFADPCYIKESDTYYAFATNKIVRPGQPDQVNIQLATSEDFKTWHLSDKDALPQVGNWSTGHFVWAPDVVQLVSSYTPQDIETIANTVKG